MNSNFLIFELLLS